VRIGRGISGVAFVQGSQHDEGDQSCQKGHHHERIEDAKPWPRKRRYDRATDCEIVIPSPVLLLKTPMIREEGNKELSEVTCSSLRTSRDQRSRVPFVFDDEKIIGDQKQIISSCTIASDEVKSVYSDSNDRQIRQIAKSNMIIKRQVIALYGRDRSKNKLIYSSEPSELEMRTLLNDFSLILIALRSS